MHFDKLLIYFMIIGLIGFSESYKFLAILPTNHISHFIFGSALMKRLAEKGHTVYVISSFPQKKPIKNYHDIPIAKDITAEKGQKAYVTSLFPQKEPIKTFYDKAFAKPITNKGKNKPKDNLDLNDKILKSPNVKKLLTIKHKFHAVICETYYAEALFGISEHFGAPLIGLSTYGNTPWNMELVGSPSPPSYVPSIGTTYSDDMSFTQRIANLVDYSANIQGNYWLRLSRHIESYYRHFPYLKRSLHAVRNNMALVLVNAHDSYDYPRPYVPAQIPVSGMHIRRQTQPLPRDIEKFINDAKHGVIYFSMGANENTKDILFSKRKIAKIFKEFKSLKQRVLWKLDKGASLIDTSSTDNILIRNWFPQQDILAHKNVKVFITQGGLLSISESIYHAKPFIGIPALREHEVNMAKPKVDGIAISLHYKTLRAADITTAVNEIVSNTNFTKRAKAMSEIYRDQPMFPLDLAVYWVEHVARHKGTTYLRCASLDLDFFRYHNLDVIILPNAALLLAIYYIIKIWSNIQILI